MDTIEDVIHEVSFFDLVLFNSNGFIPEIIKKFTRSEFGISHVGLIYIKGNKKKCKYKYNQICNRNCKENVQLWESTNHLDCNDCKLGFPTKGCHLVKFSDKIKLSYINSIYIRKLNYDLNHVNIKFKIVKFKKYIKEIYSMGYENNVFNLIQSVLKIIPNRNELKSIEYNKNTSHLLYIKQKNPNYNSQRVFCSSLVADTLFYCGILSNKSNTKKYFKLHPNEYSPCDFENNHNLNMVTGLNYSNIIEVIDELLLL